MLNACGNNKTYSVKTKWKFHSFHGTDGLKERIDSMREPILVYLDPDPDGVFAGYLVMRYLALIGKKFIWYINTNRDHGWTLPMDKIVGKDIIAVDFVIEKSTVEKIVELGSNLVSMDHHMNGAELIDVIDKGVRGTVINNQYPFEEDTGRYLSGAGVVFEVLRSIDERFDVLDNRSIVGITLLSDVRDIENPYARAYLKELYNHKYKGYIKYLLDGIIGPRDYRFGVPRLDRNTVDFQLSPALNACFRFNAEDHAVNFIMGSGYINLDYHKFQKELVRKINEVIHEVIYPNLKVCYFMDWDVELSDVSHYEILPSYVGLVASSRLDGLHSCICYMISRDSNGRKYVRRASFRGNVNGLPYWSALEGLIHGIGHESAFGIKELTPSDKLFRLCSEKCAEVDKNSGYVKNISQVDNLAFFVRNKGYEYGEYNMYCLSQHRKFIKYIGSNIQNKRSGANFFEYAVDGIIVMCFDKETNFENGLIYPINERGMLCMYLEKNVDIS